MTKQEAISELTRAAELCPTTPLAEACRMAAIEALGERPVVWSDNDDYTLGARNQYDMDRLALETVPSAQQDCDGCKWSDAIGYGECHHCKRAFEDMYEKGEQP